MSLLLCEISVFNELETIYAFKQDLTLDTQHLIFLWLQLIDLSLLVRPKSMVLGQLWTANEWQHQDMLKIPSLWSALAPSLELCLYNSQIQPNPKVI